MKRCGNKNCPLPQPLKLSKFNKKASSPDGLQNYCKTCQSMSNARIRARNPDYAKVRQTRNMMKNPERYRALLRLRHAVHNGYVTKKPCEVCGSKGRVEAYLDEPYDQYRKPWDNAHIRWFCHFHHPRRSSSDNVLDLYPELEVDE